MNVGGQFKKRQKRNEKNMNNRRKDGRETWNRLLNWDKDSSSSERLSALIITTQGYKSVDPSHPLGGQDGTKDIVAYKNGVKYVVGCYFPRGQQTFNDVKKKFKEDNLGIEKNGAKGFVFVTNQELRLGERQELIDIIPNFECEIFHLEFVSSILNTPCNYGTRLDFLDIEMTKEELIAYNATKDQIIFDLTNQLFQYKKDENIKENIIETSIDIYQPVVLDGNLLSPTHTCTFCGYGFKIKGYGLSQYDNDMKYFIFTGSTSNISSTDVKTVTCPKCGNTDKI